MITLEVCANSVQSAIEAQKGGAIRVELCDNMSEGGTTPALSQIEESKQLIDIQLNTMIRPRGGDFLYSDFEFKMMKQDIHHCGQAKCDGVVFGILNIDGSIDKNRNKELLDIAKKYDMSATFHRAFDRSANLHESLEDIINIGFDRILTSGGKKTAPEGADVLKKLIEQAGDRIIIMPGAGITENNIAGLVRNTGLKEFHGTFYSLYRGAMKYIAPEFDDIKEEYSIMQTDAVRVKQAIENANNA
ncbi:copper homeostasis protein [Dysgonomonas sp. PFB1-18]|uniref:copper homeostasis protein CutC n=1 Tax=unclassified Dysgonomonas TaxID=2630389 RepID=UPI002474820E|nr:MULTISPECIES: copper homeostasis protein CutC [unclassified Dysgonomonas]MDH6310353.1 copper homeostasis protein [Dysgonomonas sp. PF1-14]MDH6340317.1 copper homeostasis protein [Dysgonomonas sp. PF1-16]MDH6381903.1 copper homeostasis protein [Dysgonomonas sp. PFB1-18]MDH6399288.1 copper homeostasis protein [Dysgonomonas sp. PF1-23]